MPPKKTTRKASQQGEADALKSAPITRFFKSSGQSVSSSTSTMVTRRAASLVNGAPVVGTAKIVVTETTGKSRKRARTPDSVPSTRAVDRVKGSARSKCKAVHEDRAEDEFENIAIALAPSSLGTLDPQLRKKPRYSSPEPGALERITIPSSQSNEEELSTTQPSPRHPFVATSVPSTTTTKTTMPPTPDQDDNEDGDEPMRVDTDGNQVLSSQSTTLSQMNLVAAQTPLKHGLGVNESPVQTHVLTPPLSDLPSSPNTPHVLDAGTKTAQIVAKIKAEAYANVPSSPEPQVALEFRDTLEEDSSEEEELVAALFVPEKKKKAMATGANKVDSPPGRTARVSARLEAKRSPDRASAKGPNVKSKPRASALRSCSPSPKRPKPKTKPDNKRPRASMNDPLDRLLNEKRVAEKKGHDDAVLLRAEKISRLVLDDTDDEEEDWMDFGETSMAVRDRLLASSASQSVGMDALAGAEGGVDDLDFTIDDDVKELFGADKGKAVLGLLDHDRAQRTPRETVAGIHLWMDEGARCLNGGMDVDSTSVCCVLPGTHQVIKRLNKALEANDVGTARLILESNVLSLLPSPQRAPAVRGLLDLALSPNVGTLSDIAMRSLSQYWVSSPEKLDDGLNLPSILNAFKRYGVSEDILSSCGWKFDEAFTASVDYNARSVVSSRIISGLATCAEYNRLRDEEIPDLIVCLLLIGADCSATPELRRDAVMALDAVCRLAFSTDCSLKDKSLYCKKIQACVSKMDGRNQVHVLDLLSSCSQQAQSLAASVAYCLLHDIPANYTESPTLLPLIDAILSNEYPQGRFAINKDTDYEALASDVALVGFVMLTIKSHLAVDEQTRSAAPPETVDSPAKVGDKPPTALEQLSAALDTLHNRIPDLRAAHLERTRIKAHIKSLSMHIYYQRLIYNRNKTAGKRTLRTYFSKR